MRKWNYFIRKAIHSLWRARWLALSTVLTLAVLFFVFGGFLIVIYNVNNFSSGWVQSVRITAFLATPTTAAEGQALAETLAGWEEVRSVRFISKEEAKARFLENYPAEEGIFEGLEENPLPSSLEIEPSEKPVTLEVLTNLKEKVTNISGVEEVFFGRELFSKLSALLSFLHFIGILLGTAFTIAIIVLCGNMIRISVYARRAELDVFQTVGATRWFVRLPFLIEGAIEGALASIIALGALLSAFFFLLEPAGDAWIAPFFEITPVFLPWSWAALTVFAGGALGGLGSFLAVERYWRAM